MGGECFSLYLHKIKRIANSASQQLSLVQIHLPHYCPMQLTTTNDERLTTIFDKCSQISSEKLAK